MAIYIYTRVDIHECIYNYMHHNYALYICTHIRMYSYVGSMVTLSKAFAYTYIYTYIHKA